LDLNFKRKIERAIGLQELLKHQVYWPVVVFGLEKPFEIQYEVKIVVRVFDNLERRLQVQERPSEEVG